MSDISRRGLLFLVIGCLAGQAAAQDAATLRLRHARARALSDSLRATDGRIRHQTLEQGAVGRAGPVMVVLPSGDGRPLADAVASRTWDAYREFAVFPDSLLAGVALVDGGIASTGGQLGARRIMSMNRPGGFSRLHLSMNAAVDVLAADAIWNLSGALLRDTLSMAWLDGRVDIQGSDRGATQAAVLELVEGRWRVTRGCLGGEAEDCAIYLGIETVPDVRRRFSAEDIRAELWRRRPATRPRSAACRDGSDEACYAAWVAHDQIPSGISARRSLVTFLRERYGVATVRGLLSGPEPSLGARLHRVTGESPAAVAGEWRRWAMVRGQRTPVRAGLREAFLVTLALSVLLAMVTRSGRWRA